MHHPSSPCENCLTQYFRSKASTLVLQGILLADDSVF